MVCYFKNQKLLKTLLCFFFVCTSSREESAYAIVPPRLYNENNIGYNIFWYCVMLNISAFNISAHIRTKSGSICFLIFNFLYVIGLFDWFLYDKQYKVNW